MNADVPMIQNTQLSLAGHLRRVWQRRETIRYLYQSNLKAGHRDKVLGHVWCLLDPMLFIGVYFLVFGILFGQTSRSRSSDFLLYLVIGVLSWRFLDTVVHQSTLCIRSHRGLIQAISFPKAVIPIAICISRLYDYLWGLVAFGMILVVMKADVSVHLLWTPLLIALQFVFVAGCAFIVAYLGAYYADTANVVQAGMRIWFYTSPIFYYATPQPGDVPGMIKDPTIQTLYMLNPMASFFDAYRHSILYGLPPAPWVLGYVIGVSLAMFLIGFLVFTRGEGEFSKYV